VSVFNADGLPGDDEGFAKVAALAAYVAGHYVVLLSEFRTPSAICPAIPA
jgi:hypothetical protein